MQVITGHKVSMSWSGQEQQVPEGKPPPETVERFARPKREPSPPDRWDVAAKSGVRMQPCIVACRVFFLLDGRHAAGSPLPQSDPGGPAKGLEGFFFQETGLGDKEQLEKRYYKSPGSLHSWFFFLVFLSQIWFHFSFGGGANHIL